MDYTPINNDHGKNSSIARSEGSPDLKAAYERHHTNYNARITKMKATPGHSLIAFEAYVEWYRFYARIQQIFGRRPAYLFAYTISKSSCCPLRTTFFRKVIISQTKKPLSKAEGSL